MRQARLLTCLLTTIASLLLAATCALAVMRHGDPGQVYAVVQVQAGFAHRPGAWVGRTILVRGEVVACLAVPSADNGRCAGLAPPDWQPSSPTPWRAAIDPMALVPAEIDPFRTLLRRLPLLGAFLPAPPILHWGAVTTYRVRLQAAVNNGCGTGACVEAILLGSAP
jgi:hypothetical protein